MEEDGENKKESKEAQKNIQENKISMEIANQWFQTVNPQKVLHVSMKMFEQVNVLIEKAVAARNRCYTTI